MIYYHVSPAKNRVFILTGGLEPILAVGEDKKVFFVDRQRLLWAVAFVSARHKTHVGDLDIWMVSGPVRNLRADKDWRGVYGTPCNVRVRDWVTAAEYVGRRPR